MSNPSMTDEQFAERRLRVRVFAACRCDLKTAIDAMRWVVSEATCEKDQNVRMFCFESVPRHIRQDLLLREARRIYEFSSQGGEKKDVPETPLFESGPGAPPGRRAGRRSTKRA